MCLGMHASCLKPIQIEQYWAPIVGKGMDVQIHPQNPGGRKSWKYGTFSGPPDINSRWRKWAIAWVKTFQTRWNLTDAMWHLWCTTPNTQSGLLYGMQGMIVVAGIHTYRISRTQQLFLWLAPKTNRGTKQVNYSITRPCKRNSDDTIIDRTLAGLHTYCASRIYA